MPQHRFLPIASLFILAVILPVLIAEPSGPTVVYSNNVTATPASAALVNTSGGSITTMVLNATTQNVRWKAFVGNVTGTLTLDDGDGYTIFDWSIATSLTGEVYATRQSGSVTWANINCSTAQNITAEEIALNHTNNPNDNISTTFNTNSHASFYVGDIEIPQNNCSSLHTYVNDTNQSVDFEEVILHDRTNQIYATLLEDAALGYRPDQQYDFQMILPERGLAGWKSSTAYYFYVELI